MPVTQVALIYATKSKHLQRIHVPDFDDSENDQAHVGFGESMMKVPIEVYREGGARAMQALIGPHDETVAGICAVVHKDTSRVIGRIVADVEIYNGGSRRTPDGHHLIRHDHADHGHVWDGKTFRKE